MQQHAMHALAAQRRATLALLDALGPADWERPCLPPWRVRDVVAHLVTVDEGIVTGRILPVLRAQSWTALERWNDEAVARLADVPPAELRSALDRWGRRMGRLAARIPAALARMRLRSHLGRQPLVVLACRRVLDEWVHTVDIATVVGKESTVPEGVAEALATGALAPLPALVLPEVDVRAGVVRLVVETGAPGDPHGSRRTWGVDFARRQYGPRVIARPDATIRLHAGTLALLAEGRRAWDEPDADVGVEGDAALAGALLTRLAR